MSPRPAQTAAAEAPDLLFPDEAPPVTILNREGAAPVLLLCDHASNAMPRRLGNLGLDEAALARHIAYDIGAADVTRHLTEALDAPAVLSGYSRLVIDLNRALDDPTSIPEISDQVVVPGNRGLTAEEARRRADALFHPYHQAVAAEIDRMMGRGVVPAIVSIHSCTPVMNGFERPWHIGVLWDQDGRIPLPLMERLARDPAICVGDNQPYSGRGAVGSTIDLHATRRGLPNVLIELRQDLIDTRHGAAEWAEVLAGPLREVLADPSIHRVARD